MTPISQHFSLEELTITQVRGADNAPPPEVIEHLKALAAELEQVRTLLGHPILINSGYRSPEVNARVGGVSNSAHLSGYAADFICPAFGTPLDICRAIATSDVKFDQLINEGAHGASLGWCHFSVATAMRRQVLTAIFSGKVASYSHGLPECRLASPLTSLS